MAVAVTRTEALTAAGCGLWAAVLLAPEGAGAMALAPLFALAVLPYRRRPEIAGLCVAAVTVVVALSGVPGENAGGLAAGFTVVFALGRYAGRRGVLVVAGLGAVLVAWDGAAVSDAVFVSTLLATLWGCGRLVARRTARAATAAAEAAALAAQDPAELAARVVAEERARLAGEALAVVREAVGAMRGHAASAEADLDRAALLAVQTEGRLAVADLRRLLGLLRAEPDPGAGAGSVVEAAGRPWARDVLVAALLAVIVVAETAAPGVDPSPLGLVLTLALAACVALRGTHAPVACALAAVPVLVALGVDAPLLLGFGTAGGLMLLSWSASVDGRASAWLALGALTAAMIAESRADDPGNEAILLGTVALAVIAGRTWAVRGREHEAAAARAAVLRAGHRAAAERAARAERLRLARELHDVASHAVGVMVLQSAAALALRDREPPAARAALAQVRRAGEEAVMELDGLFGVLDAGAVGPPGLASPEGDAPLGSALGVLVDRLGSAGLAVELVLDGEPPDHGDVARTIRRVVQEALTNAARHAPGSSVLVAIETTPHEVVVRVADDGPGPRAGDPGFGLVGLRERVRASGGELHAGPGDRGGFTVSARLPLPAGIVAPA